MTREMLAFLLVMMDLQITGVVCRSKEGVEDYGMDRENKS